MVAVLSEREINESLNAWRRCVEAAQFSDPGQTREILLELYRVLHEALCPVMTAVARANLNRSAEEAQRQADIWQQLREQVVVGEGPGEGPYITTNRGRFRVLSQSGVSLYVCERCRSPSDPWAHVCGDGS